MSQMTTRHLQASLCVMIGLTVFLALFPGAAWAQEEVTSNIYRYRDHEMSTGYYEEYEAKPLPYGPFMKGQILRRELITLSPTAESVRRRTYLSDSHRGLRFYERLTCVKCHPREALDLHTVRTEITCRQCHGPEPIAGINHYYSPMNPIRRHAYICAKCHEGASASFAAYVIHEPLAGALATRESFPALYYAYWLMLLLLVGTLAFFVPHTFMVVMREIFNPTALFVEFISKCSRSIFGKITTYRLRLNKLRSRVRKKGNAENDGNDAH